MNPSYFRIELSLDAATTRLASWLDWEAGVELIPMGLAEVVSRACDASGNWLGASLFLYSSRSWTVFEDVTGHLGSIPAAEWLKFAVNDAFVFAGYNDSIPYGELVMIRNGRVCCEFLCYDSDVKSHVCFYDPSCATVPEPTSLIDVARFIDDDEIAFAESGFLWQRIANG